MADVTSVIIEHNFDLTSIEAFYKDFSSRMGQPVFETNFDATGNYSPPVPDGFVGWVNYMDLEFDQKGNTDYIDLMHIPTEDFLCIDHKYARITGYKINHFYEWHSVGYILDKFKSKEFESDYAKECINERLNIYETLKLFGSSKCYMFNGDKHQQLLDRLLEGEPIESALIKNEIQLKKVYFQSLDPNYTYRDSTDWYDSILIDDFSDLKNAH
jgi:hypothetical protein